MSKRSLAVAIRKKLTKDTKNQVSWAVGRNLRVPASKARLVIDLIAGKDVERAMAILRFTPRSAATLILDVLKSALANAQNSETKKMPNEKIYVYRAFADEGPTMKRFLPRAMGKAGRIRHRTSHITIVLAAKQD